MKMASGLVVSTTFVDYQYVFYVFKKKNVSSDEGSECVHAEFYLGNESEFIWHTVVNGIQAKEKKYTMIEVRANDFGTKLD